MGAPASASVGRASTGARADETVTAAAFSVVSTVPTRSVRRTVAAWARSRSSVEGAGCPYVFPAPTEITATPGRRVASSASEDAVALPW